MNHFTEKKCAIVFATATQVLALKGSHGNKWMQTAPSAGVPARPALTAVCP